MPYTAMPFTAAVRPRWAHPPSRVSSSARALSAAMSPPSSSAGSTAMSLASASDGVSGGLGSHAASAAAHSSSDVPRGGTTKTPSDSCAV